MIVHSAYTCRVCQTALHGPGPLCLECDRDRDELARERAREW